MKELKRKLKRALTPYHIATTICLIVLITSLCIILKPETKKTPSGITVVSSKTKENEEITEEEAKELAIKQFKKIGEKNLEKDKINIIKIDRNGEEYYYVTSAENTAEIKIKGGQITRINSASVTE
ncbi:unknown [Clostridium sp. CAG:470]|jgi:hypothetical protein|nr:MAG: hypothetical protein BHW03_06225 [Clostridium sp. 28_17]CDE14899.1 unknown [Clostridium sp. CAG:470]